MRLSEIIGLIGADETAVKGGFNGEPEIDIEISGVSIDSRELNGKESAGNILFAALPGEHADGRSFAAEAVKRGAACVLAEGPIQGIGAPQIIVKDARAALSRISAALHGHPSERLCTIGVTGTNGKTTTTYLLESILNEAGTPGVLGTINYRYKGLVFDAPHTTPEAHELQAALARMVKAGVTHCVMEVSSHAISQKRVNDVAFDAAVYTNLTPEHLDFHGTMERYFDAKALLFKKLLKKKGAAIINMDCPWGRRLDAGLDGEIVRYSLSSHGADVYPIDYWLGPDRTEAEVMTPAGALSIATGLVGEYNLCNVLAALSASLAIGIDRDAVIRGIKNLKNVPGRLEKISPERGGFIAYVDYAHTGDALERAITALLRIKRGRLITVFGCGGNRDRAKRPQMGGIATRLSDISIITSDNPRDEDPLEIIKEIEAGIQGIKRFSPEDEAMEGGYAVMPERAEAIRKAVSLARDNDTILIAGKGHEAYQIVKGEKHHFSDFESLWSAIREREKSGLKA